MNRKQFISKCGIGCVGIIGFGLMPLGCTPTKFVTANLNGSFLEIDLSEFEYMKKEVVMHLSYLVVQYPKLSYPIAVFRSAEEEFTALLMKCTHQGTELRVYGDRLQCPAHGSEFTTKGEVQNGPADTQLRALPTEVRGNTLSISLS